MGLDLVECFLDVEKALQVKIPEPELQSIRTLGDLIAAVRSQLGRRSTEYCATSRFFYQLRRRLTEVLPLSRHQIDLRAKVTELIPPRKRRRTFSHLQATGLKLPPLRRSPTVFWLSAGLCVASGIVLAYWSGMGVALAAIPAGFVARWVTRPMAIHLYRPYDSIRALALYGASSLSEMEQRTTTLSDDEVTDKVRNIVCECLGLRPEEATDDARFVEDLGVD